jgi:hypothetical protein
MNNEAEMREVFKRLSFENQANLLIHAQQSYITQKESRNEEAFVYDRNSSLYVGIHSRGSVCPNNKS